MKALDLEAVQAFVLVADLNSFTRAAEAMDTTQSAVSLKIKRLEDGLGRRLFERTPRLVRLSAEGSAFLPAARNLVAAHQSARRRLCGRASPADRRHQPSHRRRRTAGAAEAHERIDPGLVIELHIDASRNVLEAFDGGALDAAIVLRARRHRRDGEILFEEAFGWMAAPDFNRRPASRCGWRPRPSPAACAPWRSKRSMRAGIAWTEVFVGGGVATIGAAVSAGLAVAALARRVAPPDTVDVGPRLGLPPLPSREVMLYSKPSDARARKALRTLGAAFAATG